MMTLIGKTARIKEKPDGYTSKHYKIKLGEIYEIVDVMGSNVVLLTAEGKISIWIGRVDILDTEE